ncbi:MAG: hypothetical protein GY822_05110 [Deltaproteobacteria bacterium]|nr:hypothetical protein [Deltaproteobacteria bacterium]
MHRLRNIDLDLDSWPIVYARYGAFDEAEHAIHFDIVLSEIVQKAGPSAS